MTNRKARIACVIGTRPEVIKMAPVISALMSSDKLEPYIICTAQHRSLMDTMLTIFDIKPDIDLNIMQHDQTLPMLTGNLFAQMDPLFDKNKFDCVLAQGDTTTTLVSAFMAFYYKIPFGHVEAGLRSYDMYKPFPEEMNRVLASKMATWHFVPTEREKENLVKEGMNLTGIITTGNTVIDSLYLLTKRQAPLPISIAKETRMILMTLHRRESFGEPIKNIFLAVKRLIEKFDDIEFVYSVHPNPNVKKIAHEILGNVPRVTLLEPLPYDSFVSLMNRAYFIMSDSGGIQEEAPALDKPVLILREVTERPLVVEQGMAILVGSDTNLIVSTATELLTDKAKYQSMQKGISPYGDGHAAKRIIDTLEREFDKGKS